VSKATVSSGPRSGGPPIPSASAAVRQIASMNLQRTRRGGMIWLSVAVLVLVLLSTVVALLTGSAGIDYFESSLEVMLRYLVPFVMILHGSNVMGEEVQQKTITYLFARPIPRWTLPVGKFVSNFGLGLALLLVVTLLLYLLCMLGELELFVDELPRLGVGLVTVALGALLYGAMATAFGTMISKGAFAVTLVIWGVLDAGFGFIPGALKAVAMNVHLRVIAGLYVPDTSGIFNRDPVLTISASLPVVLGLTVVWLILAFTWVSSTEYRTDK
jgi:ABC-type transport system involved in multi-copper enzyme maturation permease subunit